MKSQNISIKILILALPLIIISCKKDPEYKTSIFGTTVLEHDNATIEVSYDLDGYNNYLSGGLYWSDTANFESNLNEIEEYNIKTGEFYFDLENLNGNKTYYAQSYLDTPGEGMPNRFYSLDYSFTTPQTPEADCSTTDGIMYLEAFSSTPFTMSDLVASNQGSYYALESQFDLGDIEFRFKEKPESGIYSTNTSFTSLDDFEVSIVANISQSWNCVYQCTGYYNIHVLDDGNGGIEISFCDVTLATDGGCVTNHTITGKISN